MIKVATVFSGIGAIEHALKRMGLKHEIVFACDNGDVDILSKNIAPDIDEIDKELKELSALIETINVVTEDDELYKNELDLMLSRTLEEYSELKKNLDLVYEEDIVKQISDLLFRIIKMRNVKPARVKEYKKFVSELRIENTRTRIFNCLHSILEVANDFKKDNNMEDLGKTDVLYDSSEGIQWNDVQCDLNKLYGTLEAKKGKKIIRRMKDICERTGMLHEKINYFSVLKKLAQINDYSDKKKFVDSLYEGKENQNRVKKSYMANYDLSEDHFHWNVAFLDGKQYQNKVDLFVGGSPCQSFSLVGKQRGLEDTRGTLFYEYARLIKEIQPKVFIYENVKAILSNDEGRTWEKMKEVFDELGYEVCYTMNGKPSVLNAKDYGIPQNRERMFVVGFRKDLNLKKKFEFPKPIELNKKLQDFLIDNVSGRYYLPRKGVDFVTNEKNLRKRFTQIDGEIALCQKKNQQFNWHGDFVFVEENTDKEKTMEELEKYFLSEKVRKYVLSPGTKNFYARPEVDLEVARPLLTTMHKMHRAGVDNYVTTDGRLRKLTPRECLRLMGFCDSFKIVVSDTSMYQQAGNSIVVDVLIAIMNQIIKVYTEFGELIDE